MSFNLGGYYKTHALQLRAIVADSERRDFSRLPNEQAMEVLNDDSWAVLTPIMYGEHGAKRYSVLFKVEDNVDPGNFILDVHRSMEHLLKRILSQDEMNNLFARLSA